jgi:hypothetical protein
MNNHRVVLLTLTVMAARPAAAQWDVGLELSTTRFRASSRDTSGSSGPASFRPGDATTVGLRLNHGMGRARVDVLAAYGKAGLTATGPGLSLTDKTAGQLFEGEILLNFRVVGIGSSGAIRAELGPSLHLWKSGDENRTRLGGVTALAYEWPVTKRFSGAIRLEGILSKSWFDAGDLPPEYERQATWRYGVGLGLRYRL